MKRAYVFVNEAGRRVGESHPRAKLTDHEVDLIRQLAEGIGDVPPSYGWTPRQVEDFRFLCEGQSDEKGDVIQPRMVHEEIARKFEASVSTIKSICCYRRRAQTPARAKRAASRGGKC